MLNLYVGKVIESQAMARVFEPPLLELERLLTTAVH